LESAPGEAKTLTEKPFQGSEFRLGTNSHVKEVLITRYNAQLSLHLPANISKTTTDIAAIVVCQYAILFLQFGVKM